MREGRPSRTAGWVALARAMARDLPPQAHLADDPYGAAFEQAPRVHHALSRFGVPIHRFPAVTAWVLYMQVRTRVIDDAVRAFVAAGGRQIVVLGAGYDTRALRMPELASAQVYEIDHPATQGYKREVLARIRAESPSHYLSWDFEQRPLAELPGALAEAGCDPAARTFTIWEGVTMYLTEPAIDASLRAIRAWSPPGSQVVVQYFTRERLEHPRLSIRFVRAFVARVGEPWRFGWASDEITPYLAERGFTVSRDRSIADAGRELLPASLAAYIGREEQRIAIADVKPA